MKRITALGKALRVLNRTRYISESALRGVGLVPFPLAKLSPATLTVLPPH